MTELYPNVSEDVRNIADVAWKLTISQPSPFEAATFLNNVTNYYSGQLTEEEVEFLQFYFTLRMEMMNK